MVPQGPVKGKNHFLWSASSAFAKAAHKVCSWLPLQEARCWLLFSLPPSTALPQGQRRAVFCPVGCQPVWGYSTPDAGLCPCWTPWGSCRALRGCGRSLLTSRQTISGILSSFTVSHITEDNQIGQIDLLFLNLCWMDVASGKKTCLYNCPGDLGKRLVSAFVYLCMSNLFNLFLAQSYLGQCFPSTVFCYWAQTSSEENDGKKVMST